MHIVLHSDYMSRLSQQGRAVMVLHPGDRPPFRTTNLKLSEFFAVYFVSNANQTLTTVFSQH